MNEKPTVYTDDIDIQAIGALDRRLPEPEGLLAAGIKAAGETAKAQLFSRIQAMGRVNRVVPAPTGKAAKRLGEILDVEPGADDNTPIHKLLR